MKKTITNTVCFLSLPFFSFFFSLSAKAQVTLTSNGAGVGITNCDVRDLRVDIPAGAGSGQYEYYYGVKEAGASIMSKNVPYLVIDPQPSSPTTYKVTVFDVVTGNLIGKAEVLVSARIAGDINVFIPNVITPNGDGVNDTWNILTPNKDRITADVPINAYGYSLQIWDRNSVVVLDQNESQRSSSLPGSFYTKGLVSDIIYWNGTYNNLNNRVTPTTYYYSLKLKNCTYPSGKEYQNWIQVIW
ncbi:MAG: gliding motility-associated C-terminal domain-containing protein [Filimonas sp.]|nr:gliding motility-associated C-terminal domain-containing protein [Filimonas sp.]